MTGAEQRKSFYVIPRLSERLKHENIWVKDKLTGSFMPVSDIKEEDDKIVLYVER